MNLPLCEPFQTERPQQVVLDKILSKALWTEQQRHPSTHIPTFLYTMENIQQEKK